MNSEILGVIAMFVILVLLAIPLGRYMGKVFEGGKTWLDPVLNPLDKLFFKLGGIKPDKEMNWKQHLVALLTINLVWFLYSMLVLIFHVCLISDVTSTLSENLMMCKMRATDILMFLRNY